MADVFLPAINPVDESTPNPNGGAAPAGGFLGTGDLTSDDGDASGWEGWNTTNVVPEAGFDQFGYDIDLTNLPAGATLTGYRFEMTLRLLPDSSPQTYAEPVVVGNWSQSGGQFYWKIWAAGEDFFNYQTYVSDVKLIPADMAAHLAADTARLVYSVNIRNTNVTDAPSPVRATMGGIRVYYTEAAPTLAPKPLRQHPRTDGLGVSSQRRVWPPSRGILRGSLRQGPGAIP